VREYRRVASDDMNGQNDQIAGDVGSEQPVEAEKPVMSVDPAIRLKTNWRARLAISAAGDALFSRRELVAETMLTRRRRPLPALQPGRGASRAGGAESCRGDPCRCRRPAW
jgi:hypothetical protein